MAAQQPLERTILPERPAYFVSAGQRGGGKTTLTNMIAIATTWIPASAAWWSTDHEEQRKSLLADLGENPALICWDNIPRGMAIASPHSRRC